MKIFNSITAKDITTIGNRYENKITIKNVKEYIQYKKELKVPKELKKLEEKQKKKLIDCIIKYKSKKCSI